MPAARSASGRMGLQPSRRRISAIWPLNCTTAPHRSKMHCGMHAETDELLGTDCYKGHNGPAMPLAPEPGPERIYEGPRRYAETTTAGVDRTMTSTRHAPYGSRPASKGTLGPHLQGLCYCHDRRASRGHGASRKQSSDDLCRVGRVWVFSAYWFAKTYELSRVSRVEPQSGPEPHAKRIGGELKIGPLDFPGAPM
jgi:hypothetical protein